MTEKELVAKMLDTLVKSRKELANIDLGITKKSMPDLDKIIEHISAPLMIMVMGEFSTGKSTFINAMVGEEVTAVNATPTTAVITKLCYGTQDKIIVHFTDGTEKEYEKMAFKQLTSKTGKEGEEKTHESIEYVERQLPLDMLQYVSIIDSPGLNDINEQNSDTTKKFVNNADTMFFMFSALKPVSKTEIDAMESLTPRLKPIAIVNKMDAFDEEEENKEPEEFLDDIRVKLKDKVQAVVGISAKYALEGKLEKNETKAEIGNLKELEQAVRELVLPNRDKFKLNTLMDELGEWINNIATDIKDAEKTNQKFQDIDYGKYLDIKTKLQQNNIVLVNIVEYLKDYCITECRRYNEQAMFLLGVLYEYGIYVNQDDSKAVQYQEAAAIKNHVSAQASLGCFFAIKKEFEKADYWLNKAAAQNNKIALVMLASQKVIGKDFEKPCLQSDDDLKNAEPLLRKAANLGDDSAEYFLYILYKNGLGVDKDENRAFKYLTQSVNHGNPDAMNSFGELLVEDFKINYESKDILKKAETYFLKASEYGNAEALFNLGEIYREFGDKDIRYQKSFHFYKDSALLGDDNAQYRLAEYYLNGIGVEEDVEQAFVWYQKSAEQENSKAQNMLGRCYEEGWGVEKDSVKAIEWFMKAAEQGYAIAQHNLAWYYHNGKAVKQDYKEAFKWFKKAAEQDYANAQDLLGDYYLVGWGVESSDEQAIYWYKKAAEQGNKQGQTGLGYCFENGCGTEVDIEKAIYWYKKAAEQGDDEAKNKIAVLEKKKQNAEVRVQSDESYFEKCKRQAEQGDVEAQYELGVCYAFGDGVAKNDYLAFQCYEKAANGGSAKAQYALANFYAQGRAVTQSTYTALMWYKKAAAQGYKKAEIEIARLQNSKAGQQVNNNPDVNRKKNDTETYFERCKREAESGNVEAQYRLGLCYKNGEGTAKDKAKAYTWFQKAAQAGYLKAKYEYALLLGASSEAFGWFKEAAEQGLAEAQNMLGRFYEEGWVSMKDDVQAFEWFYKAAEQGLAVAQYNVGICCMDGRGVMQDSDVARLWLEEAAKQDYEPAKDTLRCCFGMQYWHLK